MGVAIRDGEGTDGLPSVGAPVRDDPGAGDDPTDGIARGHYLRCSQRKGPTADGGNMLHPLPALSNTLHALSNALFQPTRCRLRSDGVVVTTSVRYADCGVCGEGTEFDNNGSRTDRRRGEAGTRSATLWRQHRMAGVVGFDAIKT